MCQPNKLNEDCSTENEFNTTESNNIDTDNIFTVDKNTFEKCINNKHTADNEFK